MDPREMRLPLLQTLNEANFTIKLITIYGAIFKGRLETYNNHTITIRPYENNSGELERYPLMIAADKIVAWSCYAEEASAYDIDDIPEDCDDLEELL